MTRDQFKKHAHIYDKFIAKDYSWIHIERPSLDKHLKKILKKNMKILDAGCGSGRQIEYLLSKKIKPGNISGIDISEKMLELARTKLPPTIRLSRGDMSSKTTKLKDYNLITSSMVLNYLNNNQLRNTLTNFYKWLAPKGTIFYLVAHPVRFSRNNLNKYFTKAKYQSKHPGAPHTSSTTEPPQTISTKQ